MGFGECFSASCVPFRAIEYNANGELDIVLMRATQWDLARLLGSWELVDKWVDFETLNNNISRRTNC